MNLHIYYFFLACLLVFEIPNNVHKYLNSLYPLGNFFICHIHISSFTPCDIIFFTGSVKYFNTTLKELLAFFMLSKYSRVKYQHVDNGIPADAKLTDRNIQELSKHLYYAVYNRQKDSIINPYIYMYMRLLRVSLKVIVC